MSEIDKKELEKISRYSEIDIGPTEENVKQKIVVPLLIELGHKREELEFEYRTRTGGKIDVFIKNVLPDCKVLIDTKNYSEDLSDHIEQIKGYTFTEAALLAVLINGNEIRIYSPLRGVGFERSLLYSIKRKEIIKESAWKILYSLLGKECLDSGATIEVIESREKEIKGAITDEEKLDKEYLLKIEEIDSDIDTKEDEIEKLKLVKQELLAEKEGKISEIWRTIDLPQEAFRIDQRQYYEKPSLEGIKSVGQRKAGRVTFQELVEANLIRDGQALYFYHTQVYKGEEAQVVASSNRLKYRKDGKTYSTSELAKRLLIKYRYKTDEHGVAGPLYWKTEDMISLNNLNEELRRKRGDRR